MSANACLLDTNVILRWVQPGDPSYRLAHVTVSGLIVSGCALFYCSQNLGEFWNVLTRPAERNGYGLTPAQAHIEARRVESQFQLLPDSIEVHREWRRMLVTYAVAGVQVHDARLVAAMRVHGVTRILTFNSRDFQRFEDIEAIAPQCLFLICVTKNSAPGSAAVEIAMILWAAFSRN